MTRRQAKEDQSEEMEISESDSSGCDEEVEMWRRYGRRKGQKKARVDRAGRTSDSGWGQGSQSSSQPVDQSVSDAQRDRFQMEVESSGDSGAAGSSRQEGIEGAESRSEVVGGEGYAEEDDALMMDYMENEGVGNEEIDRFMGWTTVDLRGETLGRVRDRVRSDTSSKRKGHGYNARFREGHNKYAAVRDRQMR